VVYRPNKPQGYNFMAVREKLISLLLSVDPCPDRSAAENKGAGRRYVFWRIGRRFRKVSGEPDSPRNL